LLQEADCGNRLASRKFKEVHLKKKGGRKDSHIAKRGGGGGYRKQENTTRKPTAFDPETRQQGGKIVCLKGREEWGIDAAARQRGNHQNDVRGEGVEGAVGRLKKKKKWKIRSLQKRAKLAGYYREKLGPPE